jgi:peptide-methionine (S)-S-oxide reductase
VHLKFDPTRASYEELVRHFFTFHDPTTAHRQGNDIGSQYASALFFHSDAQRAVCERVCADLQSRLDRDSLVFHGGAAARRFEEARVRTALMSATTFFAAESHHQRYLERKPHGYCNHRVYFDWAAQPKIV